MQKRPFVLLLAWAAAVCLQAAPKQPGKPALRPPPRKPRLQSPPLPEAVSADSMFTDRDMEIGYEERKRGHCVKRFLRRL